VRKLQLAGVIDLPSTIRISEGKAKVGMSEQAPVLRFFTD
jgi:hypothetical protein